MKLKPIVLSLALSLSSAVQAGAINFSRSFDYAYQMYGSSRTLPIQVFDDGKYTYLEVSGSNQGKLTVQHSGNQVITVVPGNQDGEGFIRLPGIFPSFHVRGQGLNAEIAYMGIDKRTLSKLVQLQSSPLDAATSVPALTATPVTGLVSASSEFSGSFVVQFLPAETSTIQLQGGAESTTNALAGIPLDIRNTRKISVRFGGNAVQASPTDRAKIRAAAQSAMAADTLTIRAYSGAANAETRKRYMARRAGNVKAALVAAGVPEEKIHLVYGATDRASAPKAEIEFIRDSTRAGQPRPLLTKATSPAQEINPDWRMVRASMQAPVVGGLVIRRLALSLDGIDIGHADRATIALSLADSASCDTLIVRGYSDLPDPEARRNDANLRGQKAVAALVAAGIPEEKIRFAPVSLAPKASSPRADIVFIRNGTGVSV